ncbi:electron transfer flavoprotein subunit beta/FixA family protein [Alphaproteobacteria bacterium]|nr:electron transfer flavoprotein subunit beta/FixA family protein [Alphaproteobacteria bacterium]
MKVLVAVKRVVDYKVQIRVKSDNSGVETQNVKMSVNPPDENAIEEAVKLKEQGIAEETVAISIGDERSQDVLRTSMAMGIDRSILVKSPNSLEPLAVAKTLSKIIEKEKPDLVLMGKQAIDDDANQTGQILSALLGWPQACFISDLKIEGDKLIISREIDEGIEKLESNLPAVITCDLRLNTPRFASLPNIMKAKKKPLEVIDISTLGIDTNPKIKIIKVEEPPKRKAGIMVNDVKELVEKLKYEAKVI